MNFFIFRIFSLIFIPLIASNLGQVNQPSQFYQLNPSNETVQLSAVCRKCLSEVNINIENLDSVPDCNKDGIIACDDVFNFRLTGNCDSISLFLDHEKTQKFELCTKNNDVAFIETDSARITTNITSMIVLMDTIFVTTPKKVHKFSRTNLQWQQTAHHNYGEEVFLFISPYITEPRNNRRAKIRLCDRTKVPLSCMRFSGDDHSTINLHDVDNLSFTLEREDVDRRLNVRSDIGSNDPAYREFFKKRLKFFDFILGENTKTVFRDAVVPTFPFSLLIVGAGSDFPRMIQLIHPLYNNRITVNCTAYNKSYDYEPYSILNYLYNPPTEVLSIFLKNEKEQEILVSSVSHQTIIEAFESNSTEEISNEMCYLEPIEGIRSATSGIRLSNETFVFSNGNQMPVIIEKGEEPIRVFWNPRSGNRLNHILFSCSNGDGSEIYGYSGSQVLKLVRRRQNTETDAILVIAGCISLAFILTIATVVGIVCYRRKVGNSKSDNRRGSLSSIATVISPDEVSDRTPGQSLVLTPRPKMSFVPFYDTSDLIITEDLKQGHFGDVKRGWLSTNSTRIDVAIKSLKQPDPKTLIKEAEIIISLNHPNVLDLLGIVIDRISHQPISLLFPFMVNGDLLEYLVMRKNSPQKPNMEQLLRFAIDISSGMGYLSSNNIVHRDLAARNCFVDRSLQIKVGDFGLSRVLDGHDHAHFSTGNSFIPIHHAPDVRETGFNEATDVWSFGRVLLEIFTFGSCSICDLNFLPQPVLGIMSTCQARNQKDRPTFTEIKLRLERIDERELKTRNRISHSSNGYIRIVQ